MSLPPHVQPGRRYTLTACSRDEPRGPGGGFNARPMNYFGVQYVQGCSRHGFDDLSPMRQGMRRCAVVINNIVQKVSSKRNLMDFWSPKFLHTKEEQQIIKIMFSFSTSKSNCCSHKYFFLTKEFWKLSTNGKQVFQQRNKLQSTITIGDARDVITDK